MADDDLLPVRSVNVHTFCPRLFWLEDVAGLFAENEHVTEGLAAHRRVDKPGGVLPAPEGDEEPWHARSLWLASPKLGVSGKLDLVEEADGLVTVAVRAAGLDPYLGVYHTPHHGRPSMALDLMEPFRPLVVDSTVLGIIRRGEVNPRGFVNIGQAVAMKAHTRKAVIAAYERRMQELVTHPVFRYRISYRQVLSVQARLLARALVGEIPEMASFRTR